MALELDFSPSSLLALNLCLGFIMFGVALSIKLEHFVQLRHQKKALATGIFSQYILLPALTVLLIFILSPPPGMALGMILVAACPGGNASNFFSLLAKGNVALSVTLTAITSVTAFFTTPLSFLFWSSTIPGLRENIQVIEMSFLSLFLRMSGILLLPLLMGMACAHFYPAFSKKISNPTRILSIIILVSFVLIAFWSNISVFVERIYSVFWIVLLHNGSGLVGAYFFSRLMKNTEAVNRSVAIETAIQNSGLGLILIFTFFNGNADMAIIAAWWAIWHLISGFSFAYVMRRRPIPETL
ncbi:MAG: bile acid:sodium symporter family protein [Cyclobacteriaceae bacterium]|nr:bile acid:sodium symporter family protein [Cyclobacteriaceae bacterium]MDH4295038.1 bile acid:sodium symporter family protein [Cyclobacteriaceae bacterium]MDH5248505.1 bile acid:sodium symporter family protein [Cyclobacteriaceae bacterium]